MFHLVYDIFKCLTGTEAIEAWESKGRVKALTLLLPLIIVFTQKLNRFVM